LEGLQSQEEIHALGVKGQFIVLLQLGHDPFIHFRRQELLKPFTTEGRRQATGVPGKGVSRSTFDPTACEGRFKISSFPVCQSIVDFGGRRGRGRKRRRREREGKGEQRSVGVIDRGRGGGDGGRRFRVAVTVSSFDACMLVLLLL